MAVENAACPNCGREVLVTVPTNQYLVKVNRHGKFYDYTILQSCFCPHCKRPFYAETAFYKSK